MNEIKILESIKLFGFFNGVEFWIKWNIINPFKVWWYLNISHKPYCLQHGFFMNCDRRCNNKKLYNKEEIKNRIKEIAKEKI